MEIKNPVNELTKKADAAQKELKERQPHAFQRAQVFFTL